MVTTWNKILNNLAYKAPEIRVEYLLAELRSYVAELAELNARIATMSELEEQHLLLLDSQAEQIAELEAQLEANHE